MVSILDDGIKLPEEIELSDIELSDQSEDNTCLFDFDSQEAHRERATINKTIKELKKRGLWL